MSPKKSVNPDEEGLAIQRLGHRLQLIESLLSHQDGNHFDIALPGSDLANDDALMGYLQTSHLVGHCLSISLDALRTTRLILLDPEVDGGLRIPMIGHYSVLRTSLEAAALAVWLLGPEARQERVVRSLQARWEEILHDDKLLMVFTEHLESDTKSDLSRKQSQRRENSRAVREKKNHLRELAKVAGIVETDFNRGHPGFGPIVAEVAVHLGMRSTHTRGVWHYVSGLTHPSVSRSLSASNVEFRDGENEGVGHARITADIRMVNMALEAAFLMHTTALTLASSRGHNSALNWNPGANVPIPPWWKLDH